MGKSQTENLIVFPKFWVFIIKPCFEDLLSYPPSSPHHELAPPTSLIPTSPISTSPSVPSTSPPPLLASLAIIIVPQPTPSLTLLPISQTISPLSQFPPLPIPLTLPTSSPPSNGDKRGQKESV
ncbi:proline-rich receptor-like protein kinase PERK9 [Neltuma alba]|uniref:proline-rich receptor-like protein kinase PERK9 n=1 Tax=Neltuma alba TaxID=207710 RepID=UPI0010A376BB|nr:proline-rich receptor-like protein kinase PERK9 [Prosopis alba]